MIFEDEFYTAHGFKPEYETFDLSALDEAFAGQSIKLLTNPTRKFEREYFTLTGQKFIDLCAWAIGVLPADAQAVFDAMDIAVWRVLFIGSASDDGVTPSYIRQWWQEKTEERAKKFAGRLSPSAKAHLTPAAD